MLSEDHRQILLMREYQELSYDEIAQALEVDLGTVKSRISRARRALRKILLERGNLSGYLPSKQTEKEGRS
jgi:RNA polymerase sigma-70 factor (ECF subfamily)